MPEISRPVHTSALPLAARATGSGVFTRVTQWIADTEHILFLVGFWPIALLLYWSVLSIDNNKDVAYFLQPWVDNAREGSLAYALRGEYTNYNPPYIYVLATVSRILYWLPAATVVKIISTAFIYIGAAACGPLVTALTGSRRQAWAAAALFPLIPTVFVNGGIWAQADVVYAAVILWCLAALARGRFNGACIIFAIAVAIKLQAAVLGPVFLYLLLSGRIGLLSIALSGGAYLLALLPAYVAGRGIVDLLSIYLRQGETFRELSRNAPNIQYYLQHYGNLDYDTGVSIFFPLVLAGVVISAIALRRCMKGSPVELVALACYCAILVPYFLPKMHERYFMLASVIAYVLAFVEIRWLHIFVLCEIGSLWAYSRILLGYSYGPYIGGLAMTGAVCLLLLRLLSSGQRPGQSPLHDGMGSHEGDR